MDKKACEPLIEPFYNWNKPELAQEYARIVEKPIALSQVRSFQTPLRTVFMQAASLPGYFISLPYYNFLRDEIPFFLLFLTEIVPRRSSPDSCSRYIEPWTTLQMTCTWPSTTPCSFMAPRE
jgi:hypothetical protein